MTGQNVGYQRVSSVGQNVDRQLDGLTLDRVFTDHLSGKDTARPELEAMIRYVRTSDTVTVHSMDRLARNLDDLRRLVRELTAKGVRVVFVKERLEFSADKDDPMATLMLAILGGFAEFERSIIRERQREGIALAKARGVYRGRKPSLTRAQAQDLAQRASEREPVAHLAREFGISRETAYQYIRAARTASDIS